MSGLLRQKVDLALKLESEVKAKDKRVSAVPYSGLSEASVEGLLPQLARSFLLRF